ncbi:MAG: phage major capsid protein [Oscillospiraceae bacterium]|nr:phage major capsid protein [Oscillospiraceae bacterium]
MAYAYDNLKLEKGMYQQAGRTFTQVLEDCDPSEHYRGSPLEGLDAFQRQLKRFGIKVRGAGSDVVEKFFATADSAVLFPEYIARSVHQGMEEGDLLPELVASVTQIEGMDYRSICSDAQDESKELRAVAEGASIPATTVKTQANLVRLHKRGRMLVASYEAVRFQKLDLFSVTLRQIGAHIKRMQLEDAVDVLIHGDGNNNAAAAISTASEAGGTKPALSYDALVDFWSQFDPYEMNTMLVPSSVMLQMLKLDEFQNPLTGLNFQGTGKLTTPIGAKLLRVSSVPEGSLIGLDRRYALEQVQSGGVTVEYDKLIDRQLERAAITVISGFAKLFTGAAKVLEV